MYNTKYKNDVQQSTIIVSLLDVLQIDWNDKVISFYLHSVLK